MLEQRSIFFGTLVALSVLLGLLNAAGIYCGWYWRFDWYDMFPHALAGMCLGLFSFACYSYSVPDWRRATPQLLAVMFACALGVGVAWEFLEVSLHVEMIHKTGYLADTLEDLVLDVTGTLVVAYTVVTGYRS